jgi:hypothetical protein
VTKVSAACLAIADLELPDAELGPEGSAAGLSAIEESGGGYVPLVIGGNTTTCENPAGVGSDVQN